MATGAAAAAVVGKGLRGEEGGGAGAAAQTIAFGGSGRFKFAIPVRGPGAIQIRVQWSPRANMYAMLFAPGKKLPVSKTLATTTTSLTLNAQANAPAQQLQIWLLHLVALPLGTVVTGSVSLSFPGSESGRAEWRVFTPPTAIGKAMLATYLRSVQRVTSGQAPASALEQGLARRMSAKPATATALRTIARSFEATPRAQRVALAGPAAAQTSLAALSFESALQAQGTSLSAATAQARQLAAARPASRLPRPAQAVATTPPTVIRPATAPPPRLQILFNLIEAVDETSWDGGSDSDEIYYLLGVIRPNGTSSGFMSEQFGDFDRGERRPSYGATYQKIWEEAITGDSAMIVMVIEHDYSDRSKVFGNFLDALGDVYAELTGIIPGSAGTSAGAGAGAGAAGGAAAGFSALGLVGAALGAVIGAALGALFGWICSTMADDLIGDPIALPFTKDQAAQWEKGPGHVWTENFEGEGASYSIMLTLGHRVNFGG